MEPLLKFFALSQVAKSRGATQFRAQEIGLIAAIFPGYMGFMAGLIAAQNVSPPPVAPVEPVGNTPARRNAPVA